MAADNGQVSPRPWSPRAVALNLERTLSAFSHQPSAKTCGFRLATCGCRQRSPDNPGESTVQGVYTHGRRLKNVRYPDGRGVHYRYGAEGERRHALARVEPMVGRSVRPATPVRPRRDGKIGIVSPDYAILYLSGSLGARPAERP